MGEKDSKVLKFFRKVGNTTFSLKNLPSHLARTGNKIKETITAPKGKIPSNFRNFFHRRHAGWPEYVMLKVQITILLLFGSAVTFILTEGSWLIFGPTLLALSLLTTLLVHYQVKSAFGRDYPAYRSFVGICIGLAWGAALLLKYLPLAFEGLLSEVLLPTFIMIVVAVSAFIGFRAKYGRDYTYGTVKETKDDRAKVKIGYDIRSNVKQGTYFLDAFVPVDEGDIVKVKVDRSTLGLKGSSAEAVTEKAPNRQRGFSV